jgi:hypothetical protein
MNTNLGKIKKGTGYGNQVFPPTSKNLNEISLLEPFIVQEFFKLYNNHIKERNPRSLDKPVGLKLAYNALYNIAKKDC